MGKLISIFKIFIIFILLIILLQNVVYADQTIDTNITIGGTTAINSSETMTERLLGVVQVIGSVVSVLALVILGIRYMFSSLEEKAQMKGVLIYYVVGAILVFATSNILSAAYKAIWGLDMNRKVTNAPTPQVTTPSTNPQPTLPAETITL